MSTQALKAAVNGSNGGGGRVSVAAVPQVIQALQSEGFKKQLALALPKHLNAERMIRIALTEARKTPKLLECDVGSILASVMTLGQLGLEAGVQGQAYLVPYNDRQRGMVCQPIPGWKGLVDLVSRAGRATVWTDAVYEGDEFKYRKGDRPSIDHIPSDDGDQDDRKLTHCYAVGRVKGAEFPIIEVWSRARLEKHRDRYNKVGSSHYSFRHFEMYGRKIALLNVLKYMPTSVEILGALDLSDAADNGQAITAKQDMNGAFVPMFDALVDTSTGEIGAGPQPRGGREPGSDDDRE